MIVFDMKIIFFYLNLKFETAEVISDNLTRKHSKSVLFKKYMLFYFS